LPPGTPQGYIFEQSLIYGKSKSHPGVFEIKFHNPKFKNAIGLDPEKKLTELIKIAENDDEIKMIVLHGGQYFSSGNDLSVFMKITDFDKMVEFANYGVNKVMVNLILALAFSKKPIVAVVRGGCVGIAFTILSHVSLVYCGPDAYFKAPFMESFQSPEGTSTLIFPQ
jgi:enoyl-CoA hydratase/carnithine racemase